MRIEFQYFSRENVLLENVFIFFYMIWNFHVF